MIPPICWISLLLAARSGRSCLPLQKFSSTRSDDNPASAAILHYLTVIGEAMVNLSSELRQRHEAVPWRQIMAVRHRIVHAYFDLDLEILWDAAVNEVPELFAQIDSIYKAEFPPNQPS